MEPYGSTLLTDFTVTTAHRSTFCKDRCPSVHSAATATSWSISVPTMPFSAMISAQTVPDGSVPRRSTIRTAPYMPKRNSCGSDQATVFTSAVGIRFVCDTNCLTPIRTSPLFAVRRREPCWPQRPKADCTRSTVTAKFTAAWPSPETSARSTRTAGVISGLERWTAAAGGSAATIRSPDTTTGRLPEVCS